MISVDQALDALFALVEPLSTEQIGLRAAAGRTLRASASAARAQPPFAASVMDGYALSKEDAHTDATLEVVGEAAAGHRFAGTVSQGQAVRIFTGAPMPEGTDHVEIQEDVTVAGDRITLRDPGRPGAYVRPAGGDFAAGAELPAPRVLSAADISLLAAMNVPTVTVARRPEVAIISTGDELVMPGESPLDDQIIASNGLGLAAQLSAVGALPRLLPIARDTAESLQSAFRFARGADLIVTIGGASVGDHDLVRSVAGQAGMEQAFYKVAMRPGKPLMAGRIAGVPMVGLPGNPVSTLVCGHVFLVPLIRAMLGQGQAPAARRTAPLASPVAANGPREHYCRAKLTQDGLHVFDRQDSSLLTVLAEANALAIRPIGDPARAAGEPIDYLPLA
ncbi:MAG: molybdopterin molybdotransferase MoeA [Pseudomonadota bacterium]